MYTPFVQLWHVTVYRKGDHSIFNKIGINCLVLFLFCSCVQNEVERNFCGEERKKWEEIVSNSDLSSDSLHVLLEKCSVAHDDVAIMVICKEIGERMRLSSDFSDALAFHRQGLDAAYRVNDTIGIVQALNNLGVDFRRIGALPEASDYHYQALQILESYSGSEVEDNCKNHATTINCIGNIHLFFDNYDEAEVLFRESLVEEKEMGNDLGQANNYANIGEIFEETLQYDSAFFYYRLSMEHYINAKSNLGIGLCYIHFGRIYELQNELDKAEREYQLAYDVMSGIKDKWSFLEAILATARIRFMKKNDQEALKFIHLALEVANDIQSLEHLSKVYYLLHEYNFKRGDYIAALNDFKMSKSFEDSIQDVRKLNKVINMQLNYERDKHLQSIANLHLKSKMEAKQNSIIIYLSVLSLIVLVISLVALFYAYYIRTKSNKALKKMNKMRTNFFTNITHEFRTPLTVILGLSNQLQVEKQMTLAETKSYLKAIDRQGTHLLKLVNHLLKISKIAGMDNPQWQRDNIVIYIQMIVDSFRLYAKNKKIHLVYSSSDSVIIMDFIPSYIDNILQNLMSNAIKFSLSDSKIFVSVTKVNHHVVLKVADMGEGIIKKDLEHIFDLFYQGERAEKNNGGGIGLTYTRQMVEMMNGKIEVQSEEKKGSVFTVILPLHQSNFLTSKPQTQKEKEILSDMKLLPETIVSPDDSRSVSETIKKVHSKEFETALLIEDNEDLLLYIKSILSAKYRLVTARDGVEGLDLANELIPDIIIADIMMPNKDGLTLCSEIRESPLLNHIPIILLTARSTLNDRLKGLKKGADAYIGKPFHPDELLVQVHTLLDNRRLLKEKYMRSIFKNDVTQIKDVNIDFLQRATDIVYTEMHNPQFNTVSLADKLCISNSQLNRKLSAISGYTPSGFIMRLRIEEAKKKLAHGDKSVGQVAEECGFYDMAYFSRTFKRFTQVSPSQYRRLPR